MSFMSGEACGTCACVRRSLGRKCRVTAECALYRTIVCHPAAGVSFVPVWGSSCVGNGELMPAWSALWDFFGPLGGVFVHFW